MSTLSATMTSKRSVEAAPINYLAILVGAVAAFVIAALYYSVLFGELWLQLRRLNPTSVGEVSPSPLQPLMNFGVTLIIAYVIAQLVGRLGITDWKGGLRLGASLWIAFPGMLWLGAIMWENTPWQLAALHGGDWLIKCLLFAVIPSVWRRTR
jgi:hypothetical protein